MRKLAASVATGVLSMGLMVSPTFAATPGATDGGSAVIESQTLSNAQVTPFSTASVGGGTWNYGVTPSLNKGKHVYSDYMHRSKVHSSSAIIGSDTDSSGRIGAGTWSEADAYGWPWQTGYTYWNTY